MEQTTKIYGRKLVYRQNRNGKVIIEEAVGRDIRVVRDGFVIVSGKWRTFIPSNNVEYFFYTVEDLVARHEIEGLQ